MWTQLITKKEARFSDRITIGGVYVSSNNLMKQKAKSVCLKGVVVFLSFQNVNLFNSNPGQLAGFFCYVELFTHKGEKLEMEISY